MIYSGESINNQFGNLSEINVTLNLNTAISKHCKIRQYWSWRRDILNSGSLISFLN